MKASRLLGVVCACTIGSANAALFDIKATSIDSRFTDFTLRFDDTSGDGLLQADEVVQFSGFTLTNPLAPSADGFYESVVGTPDFAFTGVSTISGVVTYNVISNWGFERATDSSPLCCSSGFWTYSISSVPAPVSFEARGKITQLWAVDENGLPIDTSGYPFQLGDDFHVLFTYDPTAIGFPSQGGYVMVYDAITNLLATVGSYSASALGGRMLISNDLPLGSGIFEDIFDFTTYSPNILGDAVGDFVPRAIMGQVGAKDGTCLDSTALPIAPPDTDICTSPSFMRIEFEPQTSDPNADFPAFMYAQSGSISITPVTGATPTGTSVPVSASTTLPDGSTTFVALSFDTVASAGETSVTPTPSTDGPPPPDGFQLVGNPIYYDVSTTATFSGNITICFTWEEGQVVDESAIRLQHYESGTWNDVTTSVDTVANLICGSVTSLSPFALVTELPYQFEGFFPPVDNSPVLNIMKAGQSVPVKFRLGGYHGLEIFEVGYPASTSIGCSGSAGVDVVETTTAGTSGLQYDSTTDQYTYVWKTDRSWADSCRQLVLHFKEDSVQIAKFQFRK